MSGLNNIMAKVIPRFLDHSERAKYLDLLWTSIAGLETRQEVKNFFKDLLSESEAVMLARRILIAKMLLEGKTYLEIMDELGAGVDTIGRVSQWLNSGFGGYEKAIKAFERALAHRKEVEDSKHLEPYSFAWLKNKYPLHFLFFNLLDSVAKSKEKKHEEVSNWKKGR
jgi:TrpR-related protein YerC/YecD